MVQIVTIDTPGLGDRSYIAHDGKVAVVVDPQRDTDRIDAVTEALGLRVALVLETHIHNDYLTGGLALARATGASYVVAADDDVAFDHVGARHGDRLEAGGLQVTVVGTPGHTPHHLSYVVGAAGGPPVSVFSGGSMLFGAVGRTDLIAAGRTDALTRAQYRSVRRLAANLGDDVAVFPTHGFGSFCSATKTTGTSSTIGNERSQNLALITDYEDAFVAELVSGLRAYPSYYVHMGPANARGPRPPDLSLPRWLEAGDVRRRIDAGQWVVDLRPRSLFAEQHLSGSISIEFGDAFATYVGWTLPWGEPLSLVGESPEQLLQARRELCRIGIDDLAGVTADDPRAAGDGALSAYRVADFADLAKAWSDDVVVLDVRRADEWASGHLRGARHLPLHELDQAMTSVPRRRLWVHCASGFRSSIAASLLARAGCDVTYVNDDWENAKGAGLPMAG